MFTTTSVHTLVMLPGDLATGVKSFSHPDATFDFEVGEDGLLDYDTLLDAIVSGRGTDTLIVDVTP